jgi:hypothetical protein
MKEERAIVHHAFGLVASFLFWIMGWLCLYYAGYEIFKKIDDLISLIYTFFVFLIVSIVGPLSSILIYSWKIEVKDNVIKIFKIFGLIKKKYKFKSIKNENIKIKANGTIKIKFNDGFSICIDPFAVGYKKFVKLLSNRGNSG